MITSSRFQFKSVKIRRLRKYIIYFLFKSLFGYYYHIIIITIITILASLFYYSTFINILLLIINQHYVGMAQFCKREFLTDSIVMGVRLRRTRLVDQFDRSLNTTKKQHQLRSVPKNLEAAWSSEFKRVGSGDVKITVQGQTIYASSTILAKRSDYFQRMFQGTWAECNRSSNIKLHRSTSSGSSIISNNSNNSDNSNNSNNINNEEVINNNNHNNNNNDKNGIVNNDNNSNNKDSKDYNYHIEIKDFDYNTTIQMLLFLYTDQVELSECTNMWDLYTISNKYLVTDLELKAKAKIIEDISVSNAAEGLFGNAWKWPELKKKFLKFVVKHFHAIRNSPGYKYIVANQSKYPMYLEINSEILLNLVPEVTTINTTTTTTTS